MEEEKIKEIYDKNILFAVKAKKNLYDFKKYIEDNLTPAKKELFQAASIYWKGYIAALEDLKSGEQTRFDANDMFYTL